MALFLCWVVFPGLLALLSLGCGLFLERCAGVRLRGPLIAPAGFALLVVASSFTMLWSWSAQLATPLVIALAVAGFAASRPWTARRLDGWAAFCAVAVFVVFAAPVLFSGTATFAGYIRLDDTATFLALTDRAMDHGRSLSGLAPSSYEATVALNIKAYPLGSLLPLGIGGKIVGQDLAWLYQPYLAFCAALLALVLYQLAALVVESPRARALVGFVAAQPALLFGYALWGGIKELAAAPVIALFPALSAVAFQRRATARGFLPIAVAGAAVLGILSLAAVPWLLPVVAIVAVIAWRQRNFLRGLVGVAFLIVLSIPVLAAGTRFVQPSTTSALRSGEDIGNLVHALSPLQIFGIWPIGDFRLRPDNMAPTYVLIAVLVFAGVLGLIGAWQRRAWELHLYVATAAVGCLLFGVFAGPWIAGKAFTMASPAFVLAGLVGCAVLISRGRRTEGVVAGLAIAVGVLWSNALAYHDVNLAPRAQLTELEQIGKKFAGDGPTLMTEYQPYGVRHFLRETDPEGASELRRRFVYLRNGKTLGKGTSADLDAFRLDQILVYRTIVLRRSPLESRPPSPYRLVWRKRYYEVWQRPVAGPQIVEHIPMGLGAQPAAIPPCSLARRIGRRGSQLVAATHAPAAIFPLPSLEHPSSWQTWEPDPRALVPDGSGEIAGDVEVPAAGPYEFWVGRSFRGRLGLYVDGHRLSTRRHRLSYATDYTSFGTTQLGAGTHRVQLVYERPAPEPGAGGEPWPMGPLVVSLSTPEPELAFVRGRDARTLCGRLIDWIEVLAPGR